MRAKPIKGKAINVKRARALIFILGIDQLYRDGSS